MDDPVIEYIAAWVEHWVGEPTGEITVEEMAEFLHQHGYNLVPPDEETVFTAKEYWKAVVYVTRRRLANPDRLISIHWKP